jgi:cysteine synthase
LLACSTPEFLDAFVEPSQHSAGLPEVASLLRGWGLTRVKVITVWVVPEGHAKVFLKLEYFNPTGSYKDRMAKSMIEEAESKGKLQPGMTVVEASGGSTGSSLAFVCAIKRYQFRVAASNAFAIEKLRTIRALGATVDIIHSPSGSVTADLIPSMIHHAQAVASQERHLFIDQFNNTDSLPGYDLIGKELIEQFQNGIDVFCGTFGTAGMVTGVSRVLESRWPEIRVIVLGRNLHPFSQRVPRLSWCGGCWGGFYSTSPQSQLI